MYNVKVEGLSADSKKLRFEYLIGAVNHTDCETKIMQIVEEIGGFTFSSITNQKETKVDSILKGGNDADKWYLGKIEFSDVIDGKTKKNVVNSYVLAEDFKEAFEMISAKYKDTVMDWQILSVALTKINEVIE